MRSGNQGAPRTETSPQEDAAFWDSRLRSPACTDADRAAFAEWRDRAPANAEAYEALQGALGSLHAAFDFSAELRSMRDRALEHRPTPRWRMAAAIAVSAGLAGAALFLPVGPSPERGLQVSSAGASAFQTGVGERLTVTLADGSAVTLNTRSRVEVNYAAARRDVKLVSGQAIFEVAKDRSRPFVVTAGTRRVTALGTVFEVRLDGEKVKVTMLEGKVAVEPTRPTVLQTLVGPERELVTGEQLVADLDALGSSVSRTDPQAATSWRQGRVVFVDTPLTEAVAEMNRYSATPILVGDASLARFKVNGMFLTNQPLSFVGAVTAYYPIEARADSRGATVLAPRG